MLFEFFGQQLFCVRNNPQACPIKCCMNCIECLPEEASRYLNGLDGIREIRLRDGKGMKVNVNGKWFWFGKNSLITSAQNALLFENVCEEFVKKACNRSVYAYEKMLAQGYFTLSDGSRVGVCGELSQDGVFRNYTSLCIRTANYFHCVQAPFCDSVIVAGAPSSGKTTYLRDLACRLSQTQNVVVVDERGEISSCVGFEKRSDCDVLKYAGKRYAFQIAVRSMSPDWIICDELAEEDLPLLPSVSVSGVKLAASIHAADFKTLASRLGAKLSCFSFAVLLQRNTFRQTVAQVRLEENDRPIFQEIAPQ